MVSRSFCSSGCGHFLHVYCVSFFASRNYRGIWSGPLKGQVKLISIFDSSHFSAATNAGQYRPGHITLVSMGDPSTEAYNLEILSGS